MKAIRVHHFGGPEVIRCEEVPVPEVGPGEVLVRVSAVGVNPPDWYMREGMPGVPREMLPPMSLPITLGTDVSGVVEAVAGDVEGFTEGDEVFGMVRFPTSLQGGAYAEYVTAPASDLAHKPAGVEHLHAAGAAMSGLTAWQFLVELGHDHPSPFQAEQHRPVSIDSSTAVLVNGAAGGVGHFAVQLAKWKGANVIAVASGEHEEFLRDLGADQFIDYT
ncbi:NADP-dependent oxidoreductase, partial [Bacillus mobilis]|uniref:NADP-dependent oxidoreductase n=2 Tax=Bacillati TaxID=1783272 RepID=UPI00363479B1